MGTVVERRRPSSGVLTTGLSRAFLEPEGTARRVQVIDVYGSCTLPVIVKKEDFVDIEWHARCRRCPGCLRARQFLWSLRAQAEIMLAPKTIFFTGTWANQTDDIEVIKEDVTKWLKRLRYYATERSIELRYLVVPERHKSGNWHIHALIHSELSLTTRMVESPWKLGFTYAKIADLGAAAYITKYLVKDLVEADDGVERPRIRASKAKYLGKKLQDGFEGPEVKLSDSYGGWVVVRDEELVKELLANREKEGIQEIWRKNLQQAVREFERKANPERKVMLNLLEGRKRKRELLSPR